MSFKITPDLLSKIDEISKDDLRTRSATVRIALACYVETRRRRSAKVL